MDAWTHNLPVAGPMVSGALMGDLRVSQPSSLPSWSAKIIGDLISYKNDGKYCTMILGQVLISAMSDVSRGACHGRRCGSGAGGHVGGEDIVRVPVEVLAGAVIPRGGAGIGVPGGDLEEQVDPGIQHGCGESMAEHVRVGR